MKRIIFTACQKGGTGKTTFTTELVCWLRSNYPELKIMVYDTDSGVGGLEAVLGERDGEGDLIEGQDPARTVGLIDLHSPNDRLMLANVVEHGADIVVVDTPSGALELMSKVLDDGDGLNELAALYRDNGFRLCILHVIDHLEISAISVGEYLSSLDDNADFVVVRNRQFGEADSDFPFWVGFGDDERGEMVGGNVRRQFQERGGIEIQMPRLHSGCYAKVKWMRRTFESAMESRTLQVAEKALIKRFRKLCAEQFEVVKALILPTE